jgi:hypothetical protein
MLTTVVVDDDNVVQMLYQNILDMENFFSHLPCFFFTPQNQILTSKTSINTNQIFENFGFYLPTFSDIEKQVFQPFAFQKPKKK